MSRIFGCASPRVAWAAISCASCSRGATTPIRPARPAPWRKLRRSMYAPKDRTASEVYARALLGRKVNDVTARTCRGYGLAVTRVTPRFGQGALLPCPEPSRVPKLRHAMRWTCAVFIVLAGSPLFGQSAGQRLFEVNCALCHGTDGLGGELGPPVAGRARNRTDAELTSVIGNGLPSRGMPAIPLNSGEASQIIAYL